MSNQNRTTIFLATLLCISILGHLAIDAHQEAMAWKRDAEQSEKLYLEYERLYLNCKNQK